MASLVGMFLLLLVVFYNVEVTTEQTKCELAEQSGLHTHWDFWNGCLVQTPEGYWVDSDNPLAIEFIAK